MAFCPAVICQHSYLFSAGLSAGADSCCKKRKQRQFYHLNFYFAHVDEFPAPHARLADFIGKNRCYQQCSGFSGTSGHAHD